jgi:hypothetical protein
VWRGSDVARRSSDQGDSVGNAEISGDLDVSPSPFSHETTQTLIAIGELRWDDDDRCLRRQCLESINDRGCLNIRET